MSRLLCAMCCLLFSIAFSQNREIVVDTTITSNHSVTVNGKSIPYQATAGTQPVWNDKGEPIATLFYTYYKKSNSQAKDRPIVFSFNGGPGSASVWMHIAYTGPVLLNIDDEGYPVQPYGIKDNPYSIIDVADIVFVDPVNTGYSRMLPDKEGKMPEKDVFYGINADIKYLAEWMNTFVSRNNRWESPKYIIGESYGGTRVMGLANELQNTQFMYLNGVIMVSPADYKVLYSGNPISEALHLPYYTATAWHHKQLSSELQNKDLLDILPEVENYAINTLLPVISKGGFATAEEKQAVAKKMAYYSGLSETVILRSNLRVPTNFFWKELLRDQGYTVGRLDSRYLGLDKDDASDSPDFNAELSSWLHSFTPPINYYIREHLQFKTDVTYNMLADVSPWDRRNDNTREGLRLAMAQNPYLKVLFQSGYYDGATTYFNAKYTMWQIDPSGKMKDRFTFKGYKSGHMMYLRNEDLIQANNDLREFIKNSMANGKAAKY
ncbi:carboxypeptidase [Hanstruepera neustonica]|uniref:Carboxypeptidase n=1 Tax=Hanstruepera neustonica TaxID=1445657 RepID=A0A2K1DYP6_9FLAO|nr:carboxypeptidase [Hanstruepera neustonica]PNQ73140.1 carboxypeptidase [Hanstruepera neustonica]